MAAAKGERGRPDHPMARRGILILGGGLVSAGLTGCAPASPGTQGSTRVGPRSAAVRRAEQARRFSGGRRVPVRLAAEESDVDLGPVAVRTWTYGGELPGHELRVRRGDTISARLSNSLPQPTTVHWHGIALRNDMDGVPNLTQRAIAPTQDFRYEFTVPDAGSYWFHPHVGVQLDRGLYAPLIVEDPADGADYDTELVIVVDDWLDGLGRDPDSVLADLVRNGMTMSGNDSGSMPGMPGMPPRSPASGRGMSMPQSTALGGDAGDVTYPYVLANGRTADAARTYQVKPGQRIRLRIINAASDTAFRVGVPGVPLRVTHTDGFPVVQQQAPSMLLGMGERVDAVIRVPETSVPILTLAEGRDGYAQVNLRSSRTPAADGKTQASRMAGLPLLRPADLRAAEDVRLPARTPDVVHDLVLDGPGRRYDWTINGTSYDPDRGLPVYAGQRVRLRFQNRSEMFHPMHLHGHTFHVRGAGGQGARKDTLIVLPGETVEVDFDADNPGQWLTHCHNIYHGEAGMMTVVSYRE